MVVETTSLPGVLLIEPTTFRDARGAIVKGWSHERYSALGIPPFVQDSLIQSNHRVLRGLHLQHPGGQGKLLYSLEGEVFDVAVDVRRGSPFFGRSVSLILSSANHRQLFIPPGFAHGFQVLSASALLMCKFTAYDHAPSAVTIRWDDPEIGISWPLSEPLLSERDLAAPLLHEATSLLPSIS